jgi:hypothetical protein
MRRSSDPILLVLLAASLCNVYQYRTYARPSATPPRPALKSGDKVPPFSARDSDGNKVTLRLSEGQRSFTSLVRNADGATET